MAEDETTDESNSEEEKFDDSDELGDDSENSDGE